MKNVRCFLTAGLGIQSAFGTVSRVVPGIAIVASPTNWLEMQVPVGLNQKLQVDIQPSMFKQVLWMILMYPKVWEPLFQDVGRAVVNGPGEERECDTEMPKTKMGWKMRNFTTILSELQPGEEASNHWLWCVLQTQSSGTAVACSRRNWMSKVWARPTQEQSSCLWCCVGGRRRPWICLILTKHYGILFPVLFLELVAISSLIFLKLTHDFICTHMCIYINIQNYSLIIIILRMQLALYCWVIISMD